MTYALTARKIADRAAVAAMPREEAQQAVSWGELAHLLWNDPKPDCWRGITDGEDSLVDE